MEEKHFVRKTFKTPKSQAEYCQTGRSILTSNEGIWRFPRSFQKMMKLQQFVHLSPTADTVVVFFVIGCAGAFMIVTISLLELCPVLPKQFGKYEGWKRLPIYFAFIISGGFMASAVGICVAAPHKALILLGAGSGWHLVLIAWSKLASAVKSTIDTWKNTPG